MSLHICPAQGKGGDGPSRPAPTIPPHLETILFRLRVAGVEPVRHGRFLGYRNVSRIPRELWPAIRIAEPLLRRLLPDSETPFQARERRIDR